MIAQRRFLSCGFAAIQRIERIQNPAGLAPKGCFIAVTTGSIASADRPGCPAALLRFAPIQRLERKQDPADLARKGRFIAAQAIKREAGQISQP